MTCKLTKAETAALNAIQTEPAVSIWISRSVGRQWFAGEYRIPSATVDALARKGAIRKVARAGDINGTFTAI